MITRPAAALRWSDIAAEVVPLYRDVADPEIVARFTVPGDPESKQRPRVSSRNGKVYTPAPTRAAEQLVGWAFRQAVGPMTPDASGTFGAHLSFHCKGGQRRDVDNMAKLVLDGLNGLLWADDSQVSELSAVLRRWESNPRIEAVVYRTVTDGHPTHECEQCGKVFLLYPSRKRPRFCSTACFTAHRGGGQAGTCMNCGKSFPVKPSDLAGAFHCSRACRTASGQVAVTCEVCGTEFMRAKVRAKRRRDTCSDECAISGARARGEQARRGTCGVCGGPTSQKQHQRCYACRVADKAIPGREWNRNTRITPVGG